MDIEGCKSYATEEGLAAGLRRNGFTDDRHVVVCNRRGRFTAIFPFSNITDGDVTRYVRAGFMTLG